MSKRAPGKPKSSARQSRSSGPRAPRASRRVPPRHRVRTWALSVIGILLFGVAAWAVVNSAHYTPQTSVASSGNSHQDLVGMPAPSIPLPSTSGGPISLEQYRGSKVVVYFYEGAG